jgi:thioredoxin-related protein
MKKPFLPILGAMFALLFTLTTGCTAAQKQGGVTDDPLWTSDYDAALLKAKETGRRVLVNFTGSDWCHWCIRMDEETFSQEDFKKYAEEHLVLVYVDKPMRKKIDAEQSAKNTRLMRQYGVDGFPTFVVLDPDGHEVDRRSGYVPGGPKGFIYFLNVTANVEKPVAK